MTDPRVLIVTAVDREAEAIGAIDGAMIVAGGVGRTNAASATTEAIIRHGPFAAALSMGVAGALPGSGLQIGDVAAASCCVYAEEGLMTPSGFRDMAGLGFALGDFTGNAVPVDEGVLAALRAHADAVGPIATVATCSGTDEAAQLIVERTGALAEAMEGAAVVHAAARFNVAGGELRAISNTTGNRDAQVWDLSRALDALGAAARIAIPGVLRAARDD